MLTILVTGAANSFEVPAVGDDPTLTDLFKTVIIKTPYTVEECEERLVGGDKTGSTLGGAILGAAIGNAIGKDREATLAGAAVGGLIGHSKSNARPHTRLHCTVSIRHHREEREVYSHSTIDFEYNGGTYRESFQK